MLRGGAWNNNDNNCRVSNRNNNNPDNRNNNNGLRLVNAMIFKREPVLSMIGLTGCAMDSPASFPDHNGQIINFRLVANVENLILS